MDEKTLLRIEDLSVDYHTSEETVYAVNHVDMELQIGQTVGLVGETGAGKTTLALSIMRLLPKKTGEIRNGRILFKGEDLLKKKDAFMQAIRGREISMVFQDPMTSLNPVLTIGKQVYEALALHNNAGLTKQELEEKTEKLLEMVGIPKQRKKDYPHEFSGGMKQRVVIAIALACNPELLIADEPTTALDVTIQAQVLSLINDLKNELGMAMILITHDLGIVAENCDYVYVMYAGEIVESGDVSTVFDPDVEHHPYTDGLFNSLPDLAKDTKRLNPIHGIMPDPTNLPSGCKFEPRCPFRSEQCHEIPHGIIDNKGHMIRCHKRFGDIR